MPDELMILFECGPFAVVQLSDGMLCVRVGDSNAVENAVFTPAQLAGLPGKLLAASVPQYETVEGFTDEVIPDA